LHADYSKRERQSQKKSRLKNEIHYARMVTVVKLAQQFLAQLPSLAHFPNPPRIGDAVIIVPIEALGPDPTSTCGLPIHAFSRSATIGNAGNSGALAG
jgi:hypothetical protein